LGGIKGFAKVLRACGKSMIANQYPWTLSGQRWHACLKAVRLAVARQMTEEITRVPD
jgi:hypothetical protein